MHFTSPENIIEELFPRENTLICLVYSISLLAAKNTFKFSIIIIIIRITKITIEHYKSNIYNKN